MQETEIPLTGGRSTETVVRIGNTVRRSISENASLVHPFLQHLAAVNCKYVPRFLGMDEKGREILSYIDGEVPRGVAFNINQLIACAKMLRAYHDAAASSEFCGKQETVCHFDFAPWNLIFRDNMPVGIIDFDDCRPGARIEDIAYFLWTFLELGTSEIADAEQLENVNILCRDYGLPSTQNLAEALLTQQERILAFRQNIVLTEKDISKRAFSEGAVKRIQKAMKWVEANHSKLATSI